MMRLPITELKYLSSHARRGVRDAALANQHPLTTPLTSLKALGRS